MPRRRIVVFAQITAVLLISLYLFVHVRLGSALGPFSKVQLLDSFEISPNATLTRQNLTAYIGAILDSSAETDLATFKCPSLDSTRYGYLQHHDSFASTQPPIRYFFALNLRNCLPPLPRLLGSMLEAIRFLGPASCALSIVEGNSPDGTAEVLAALEPQLTKLGIRTYFSLNTPLDPLGKDSDRFTSLAELHNMALHPLTTKSDHVHDDAIVLFINDVTICPDDILELAHQRVHQSADMACAMDWTGHAPAIFYDVYVARALNGDLFFDVPPSVSWARATDLFWNEPIAKERFARHEPFQVYACWNGAVVFTAKPVVEGKVRFRAARKEKGECHAREPGLFCKDMWFEGYGRIMVVPSVSLEYTVETGKRIKELKGFTLDWVGEADAGTNVDWKPPPDQVKCMPTFDNQSWRPWNETLV